MKTFYFFIFLIASQMFFSQNLGEYRTLLKTAESSEKSAKMLMDKSEGSYKKTNKAIYSAFFGVGQILMAKHVFNPFKKMSYFNEGKKTLERSVKSEPKNLEIRLMRLITQEKAPKFLGYSQNISEDKTFLTKEYQKTTDADLKLYIKKYLNL